MPFETARAAGAAGKTASTAHVLRHKPSQCEKENECSPFSFRKGDDLPQFWGRRVFPEDAHSLVRLAQFECGPDSAESFDTLARDLCTRYRCAWRGARRMLIQHLESAKDDDTVLEKPHAGEPNDAEVCCYFARLQPSQVQRSKWYAQALKADPRCLTALLAIADEHRRAERFTEAVNSYRSALQQHGQLPLRSLYRLGEVLVQSGHGGEGREHLRRVLQESTVACGYRVHAAVTMALSYVMDQRHERALQCCRLAEGLHEESVAGGRRVPLRELRLARTLHGLTHLRMGHLDSAIESLRSAASDADDQAGWHWEEVVQTLLGYAETLRGNWDRAEQHLMTATQLCGVAAPGTDVLVGMAYLRQVQGDADAASTLLSRALQEDRNSPSALMRMGYLLLCEGQFERAVQFLQKCLQQPTGSLAYGSAQKGTVHLHLCVALHWRTVELGGDRAEYDSLAQGHFRSSYELQPDLCYALASLAGTRFESSEAAVALFVKGNPPRMGMIDLSLQQASVVLFYAEECGVVRLTRGRSMRSMATSPVLGEEASLARAGSSPGLPGKPWLASLGSTLGTTVSTAAPTGGQVSLGSTLGTTSTTTPTSDASSRTALERATFSDTAATEGAGPSAMQELRQHLPTEKVLLWADVELGGCVSRGEFAVVSRGRLRSSQSDVVVKMLHQKDFLHNTPAALDLLGEIAILAELSHPRIVVFAGACLEPQRVALVTELEPGGNLHHALHVRQRDFALRERFQLAKELLEGVRYLHQQQPAIAHFDLKSSNLVLDADGRHLRLCDFGLARVLHAEAAATESPPPSRGGSARYMAPECYDSNLGPLTEKADVWSSGCILIEIFGSCLPYAECSNVQQILKNMLVHRCGPSIPSAIEANIRGAIAFTFVFEVRERLAVAQVLVLLQTAASSAEDRARPARSVA